MGHGFCIVLRGKARGYAVFLRGLEGWVDARECIVKQAIAAIEGLGGNNLPERRGARKKAAAPKKHARRRMSAAGRAKLARLMKQRWAARKKAGKTKLGA